MRFDQIHIPSVFGTLSASLSTSLCELYNPLTNHPIPSALCPIFSNLILESPASAAFTVLTTYIVRHDTLVEHPDRCDLLYPYPSGTGFPALTCKKIIYFCDNSHLQVLYLASQFLSNLFIATRDIMHTLWERPQSSCSTRNIVACLDETRRASTAGIPDDPIAFIYAFAEQC